jgi:hypothetical protein
VLAYELINRLAELAVGGRGEGHRTLALHDDRRSGPWLGADVINRFSGLTVKAIKWACPEAFYAWGCSGREDLN